MKYSAALITAFAAVTRVAWWQFAGGPIVGGDSDRYLDFAQRIAKGELTTVAEWPFHQLYSVTIAPMFVFQWPSAGYIQFVHVAISSATVLLMYLTGVRLLGKKYGIVVGIVGSLHLPFLFWMPYILHGNDVSLCDGAVSVGIDCNVDGQQWFTSAHLGDQCRCIHRRSAFGSAGCRSDGHLPGVWAAGQTIRTTCGDRGRRRHCLARVRRCSHGPIVACSAPAAFAYTHGRSKPLGKHQGVHWKHGGCARIRCAR